MGGGDEKGKSDGDQAQGRTTLVTLRRLRMKQLQAGSLPSPRMGRRSGRKFARPGARRAAAAGREVTQHLRFLAPKHTPSPAVTPLQGTKGRCRGGAKGGTKAQRRESWDSAPRRLEEAPRFSLQSPPGLWCILPHLVVVLAHCHLMSVAGTCASSRFSPARRPVFTSPQGSWVLPEEANPES